MSSELKKRVLEIYEKKKAEKDKDKKDDIKDEVEKKVEEEIKKKDKKIKDTPKNKILMNKKDGYEITDTEDIDKEFLDSDIEHDADNEDEEEVYEHEHEHETRLPPYLYIDYDENSIRLAKKAGYKTICIDKNKGLTKENMDKITNHEYGDIHVIINCWKVLTHSNLNIYSFDCSATDTNKFEVKMEETIKWGSKLYMKEQLSKEKRREHTPFRENVVEFLRLLHQKNVKIFIISNSDHSFMNALFDYYKLGSYIEEIFTPSKCGLPTGKIQNHEDSYKDRRKINKTRMFVCIERYIGRLPKK